MNNQKLTIAAAVLLTVLVLVAAACWFAFRPEVTEGQKILTVDVIHQDGSLRTFTVETGENFLGAALTGAGLLAGDQAAYGLFVRTVDGEAVDESKQEWWGYTRNGEYVEFGVDMCPIQDGEHYEFTFHTGW